MIRIQLLQPGAGRRSWWYLGLVLGFLGIAGCGSSLLETAKVTGKVTLAGHPVTQGKVMFRPPQGPVAAGALGPGGAYELTTFKPGDGAILGECAVAIVAPTWGAPMGGIKNPPPPPPEETIPAKFHNYETSGLTRTVVAAGNTFDFELSQP